VGFVRECLEEAATLGLLKEALDPRELTRIVVGSIMVAALMPEARERNGPSSTSPERVWDTLLQLIHR
jgi:hypothetical protein